MPIDDRLDPRPGQNPRAGALQPRQHFEAVVARHLRRDRRLNFQHRHPAAAGHEQIRGLDADDTATDNRDGRAGLDRYRGGAARPTPAVPAPVTSSAIGRSRGRAPVATNTMSGFVAANALGRDRLTEPDRHAKLLELDAAVRPHTGSTSVLSGAARASGICPPASVGLLPHLDEMAKSRGDARGLHAADAGADDEHPPALASRAASRD